MSKHGRVVGGLEPFVTGSHADLPGKPVGATERCACVANPWDSPGAANLIPTLAKRGHGIRPIGPTAPATAAACANSSRVGRSPRRPKVTPRRARIRRSRPTSGPFHAPRPPQAAGCRAVCASPAIRDPRKHKGRMPRTGRAGWPRMSGESATHPEVSAGRAAYCGAPESRDEHTRQVVAAGRRDKPQPRERPKVHESIANRIPQHAPGSGSPTARLPPARSRVSRMCRTDHPTHGRRRADHRLPGRTPNGAHRPQRARCAPHPDHAATHEHMTAAQITAPGRGRAALPRRDDPLPPGRGRSIPKEGARCRRR